MELTTGYNRQTDAGVIPKDWKAVPLDSICIVTSGKRLPKGYFLTESETPHPYIRVSDMRYGRVVMDEVRYVPVEAFTAISNYRIFKEDLFISVAGTLGLVGKIPDELDGANLTENADRITHIACNQDYLMYILLAPAIQRIIDSIRTVGAQPKLALTRIRKFSIPLPPTEIEQRAIATALSDVDALLDGLDRLIAKKRDIKQAAMQQLLTGKTRLPGFEREWEIKALDQIAEIRNGGTPSTLKPNFWDGDIPWCTPTDITALGGGKYLRETSRTITTAGLRSSSAELIFCKSIIMTSRATIGECAINVVPMTTNQGFKNLVPHNDVDYEFLYYLMTTKKGDLLALCAGSTFLEIGKRQLNGLEISLPCTIEEQAAIAAILSDMDAEIEALEQRRVKTRDLKKAMMQELLTGRTRLA